MQNSIDTQRALVPESRDRDGDDVVDDYRGHRFTLDVRRHGEVWTAQHRLLDVSPQQAGLAATAGRHQWTSMDPSWRTFTEARRYATEAAHAAIDALYR